MRPAVTICIPTWQGADIIGDAVACAQNQTVQNIEILIAVDYSEDATADLARAAARSDPRISLIVHTERMGWVRNVNAALDLVRGEYFCLYFHDDLIDQRYVETLIAPLRANREAIAAFCSVEQDSGTGVTTQSGRDYRGGSLQRMLDRLLLPGAGAPLRALTRSHVLRDGLRFPVGSMHGFHAQHAYLVELYARGDVLFQPEVLYRRRNWRPTALTKSWRKQELQVLGADLACCADAITRSAEAHLDEPADRALVVNAARLRLLAPLRRVEIEQRASSLISESKLFPAADPDLRFPPRWAPQAQALSRDIQALEANWKLSRAEEGGL